MPSILTPQTALDLIQGFTTQFEVKFRSAYESAKNFWQEYATEMPSSSALNAYAWMDNLSDGSLREWVGERVRENLVANDYLLKNKKFERTVAVKREDIEDDQFGIYGPKMGELGRQAKLWPDRLLAEKLKNGATDDADHHSFDAKPFFSATHPVDPSGTVSGTFSNYSSSGKALTPANFADVRQIMESYTGRDGNPRLVSPNVLMVGPALRTTAENILNTTILAPVAASDGKSVNTSTNTLQGAAKLVVNPFLTGTDWYMIDATKEVKPLIMQMRYPPDLVPRVNAADPNVFDRDEYEWGVRARGVAGYSLPFLCYKAVA